MYKILNKSKRMTYEELKACYDEKWVYLVNCDFTPFSKFISGIPVIVADYAYEGVNDGIYESYKDIKYVPRCDLIFKFEPVTLGIFPPQFEEAKLIEKIG